MDDPLDDGVEGGISSQLGSIKVEKTIIVRSANPPQAKRQQSDCDEPDAMAAAIMRHNRNDSLVPIDGPYTKSH
jgi:hypothetical protein